MRNEWFGFKKFALIYYPNRTLLLSLQNSPSISLNLKSVLPEYWVRRSASEILFPKSLREMKIFWLEKNGPRPKNRLAKNGKGRSKHFNATPKTWDFQREKRVKWKWTEQQTQTIYFPTIFIQKRKARLGGQRWIHDFPIFPLLPDSLSSTNWFLCPQKIKFFFTLFEGRRVKSVNKALIRCILVGRREKGDDDTFLFSKNVRCTERTEEFWF